MNSLPGLFLYGRKGTWKRSKWGEVVTGVAGAGSEAGEEAEKPSSRGGEKQPQTGQGLVELAAKLPSQSGPGSLNESPVSTRS